MKVQGDDVDILRFVDDTEVMAENEEQLTLKRRMEITLSAQYNMKINETTKILVLNKHN